MPVLLSVALTTCSTDGLVPPESVDSGTRVGSVAPVMQPRAPVRMAPIESQNPYPQASEPVRNTQQSVDYLDTPNLAGTGHRGSSGTQSQPSVQAAAPVQQGQRRRLPMIDSDEAMGITANQAANGQAMSVPPEGVNMDAELGTEPVTGLAQEEAQTIAEGNSAEPVVDGVGTDTPTQMNRAALPPPAAQAQMSQQPAWGDGSPVVAPKRVPQENQQVAFLPRVQNPMESEPAAPQPDVMPTSELACRRELKKMGVIFTDKPRISQGPSCGIDYPVSLQGLSGNIGVKPAVTLNCQVTLAFAKWVKNELAPSARYRYWTGIRTIEPLGGYSCRRMNNSRQRYNPMSEHARGNAIDVGKFVLKNGHEIDVRRKGLFSFREGRLLKAVRSDSCKYFTTVLGPGSNPEHWNHFHFDLRSHKSGRAYCD